MIIVPAAERNTQTIDDCKLSCQNKYSTITATKTNTLLQEMYGCNKSGQISRLPLKIKCIR